MKLHIENSIVIENNGRTTTLGKGEYEFGSASEFIKFVESLGEQSKQPLIKDDKVRKAVRAWAEAESEDCYYGEDATTLYNGSGDHIEFWSRPFTDLKQGEHYTIAELCGEGEE